MLLELSVENFAIIRRAQLEFSPGLNVLSGETGAGKSLLIDAMMVLLGGRASEEFIRTGTDQAVVTAVFDISLAPVVQQKLIEAGFDGEELIVTRAISRGGRNVSRINGRPVSVATIRRITEDLVEIHGQHHSQGLLRPEVHRSLLDAWDEVGIGSLLMQVDKLYRERERLRHKLNELSGDARQRAHTIDLYQFQLQEIDSAQLAPGEEEELRTLRNRIANAERIMSALSEGYTAVYGVDGGGASALDQTGLALASLQRVAAIEPELQPVLDLLEAATANLQEAAHTMREQLDQIHYDEETASNLEERWRLLNDLKRKYGDSISDILAYRHHVAAELHRLENAEEDAKELESILEQITDQLELACEELTLHRQQAATGFAQAIARELQDLALSSTVQFAITQQESPDGIRHQGRLVNVGPTGCDQVEIQFSANPGEPPRPLQRVASGGELSRIMLAVITALGQREDGVPTLIFDEIDAGIGGRTATMVADKLVATAHGRQVLCITHLPQIAAKAHRHFSIEKTGDSSGVETRVKPLSGEDRELEIARMLAGGQADVDLAHARALLQRGQSFRAG